jgi:hypothetical protein
MREDILRSPRKKEHQHSQCTAPAFCDFKISLCILYQNPQECKGGNEWLTG